MDRRRRCAPLEAGEIGLAETRHELEQAAEEIAEAREKLHEAAEKVE